MPFSDTSPRKELNASVPNIRSERLQPSSGGRGLVRDTGALSWSLDDDDGAGFHIEPILAQYWRVLWKHRLLILGAILAGIAIAIGVTLLTTPTYTARTTIQIDREAARVVNIQGVEPAQDTSKSDEFYQTEYGLLDSKALAERVIDTLGLTNSPSFLHASNLQRAKEASTKAGQDPRVFRDKVYKVVAANMHVEPVRGSRLVALSYASPDPAVAASVANSFANEFIATTLERRYESSSYARDFLEKQLALARGRLEDSERQAVAYAVQQQIINLHDSDSGPSDPNAAEPLVERNLSALDAAYSAAKAARIAAQAKWDQARNSSNLGLPEIQDNPTIQKLSQDEATLQSQYQDQLRLMKPKYPAMVQLKAQIDEVDARIQSAAGTIRQSIKSQYDAALTQERGLEQQVNGLKANDLDLKNRSIRYNFLQRDVDTNRTLYDGLLQRYKEVGVTAGVTANNVSIVDRAEAPLRPSSPKPLLNLALGLIAGLGFGVLGAFAMEAMDQAVQGPSDVESKLGLPILGAIPLLVRGVTPQEAMVDPRSAFWEAYYSVRTALQFSSTAGIPRSLVVVSARPGEGKSTTAVVLSMSLARLGISTLLIDSDLRKPSVHKNLNLNAGPGLSNYLTGSMTLQQVLQSSDQPGLTVMTSGPLPPTPAELLADTRLHALIAEAKQLFDVIVFDGPPVMGFADAPVIASVVEGTVLVVESGKTGRPVVLSALRRLQMANAKILGVVLAKYNPSRGDQGYGAGYGYYAYEYGEKSKKDRQNRVTAR